jgi:anaerobic selenocysteine-containing dehydrogenase
MRTTGAGEDMPPAFLDSLGAFFNIKVPVGKGLSAIPALNAIAEGKAKVLISLGGNLASSLPDTSFTETALRKSNMTVMISTKLNRSHLVTGKKALILPCLSRSDEDQVEGKPQFISVEDAMGKIGFSKGCLQPCSPNLRSEINIIAGLAQATLPQNETIDWKDLSNDYTKIRSVISALIPALTGLDKTLPGHESLYLYNPLHYRIFLTNDSKAHFSVVSLSAEQAEKGQLMLMTIRSHDQFNTSVFGLNDRYRGISNERRVIFMNQEDMEEKDIIAEQTVSILSRYDGVERKLEGYYAIPYPIRKGCAAAYFPEANSLIPANHICSTSGTPAYKSICVEVTKNV